MPLPLPLPEPDPREHTPTKQRQELEALGVVLQVCTHVSFSIYLSLSV